WRPAGPTEVIGPARNAGTSAFIQYGMQPALAREPDAFRALMREHNQALFRTARAILRDDAEAEEAVQEAWMQAYKGLESFRGDAKISTWLIRIAANEALGRLRRRKRTAEVIPSAIDHP